MKNLIALSNREQEIIYFALSRLLEFDDMGVDTLGNKLSHEQAQEEFNVLDNIRNKFKQKV